jgi:hypothetical protein
MLPRRYTTFRYAFSKIYGEEGIIRGFYRGFGLSAVAVLALIAAQKPLAVKIMDWMENERNKQMQLDHVN